jgi:hypothetical protein
MANGKKNQQSPTRGLLFSVGTLSRPLKSPAPVTSSPVQTYADTPKLITKND